MKWRLICWFSWCCLAPGLLARGGPLYQQDFEAVEVGKVPEGFLVLEGNFAVRAESGNRFLELPGAPLDSFAVQFGPATNSDVALSARIKGTAKGRRFPTFGVGLNGVAGYKLQVAPAKKLIELIKDEEVKATAPFEWSSGQWTHLRLQVRKAGDTLWKVEGKAWLSGAEPAAWMIVFEAKEEPLNGRASVFGSPFSGTPIDYDDFAVVPASSR